MDIHIGSIVKKVVRDKEISTEDLAHQMKMQPTSIRRLFRNPAIPVLTLVKFSTILNYDFFAHFSRNLKLQQSDLEKSQLEPSNAEIESLKKEILILKEVISLIGKK